MSQKMKFGFPVPIALLLISVLPFRLVGQETPAQMDVLIAYTPGVTTQFSGQAGVMAYLHSLVEGANLAYANSDINASLFLVHAVELNYAPSSDDTDLDRLTFDSDGFMDEIHQLRADYGADLVVLVKPGSSGIAWVLTEETGGPDSAFSVCGSNGGGFGIFVHELGHNMGGLHDRPNASFPGMFSYCYGYRFTGSNAIQYRTIMAYAPGSWIMRFSNPLQQYQGVALGLPEGNAQSADNARTLNFATPIVAGYSPHKPAIPEIDVAPESLKAITGSRQVIQTRVLGAPPLELQWYRGAQGNVSVPLDSTHGQGLEVVVQDGRQPYWFSASNDDGSVVSESVVVEGIASWGKATAQDQAQGSGSTYFIHSSGMRYWQEFVPSVSYLHAVQLSVSRMGSGNAFTFKMLDSNDLCLFEQTVAVNANGWVQIPIQRWVQPGRTYRLELIPGDDVSNHVVWLLNHTDNPYPAGNTSFTGGYPTNFDFAFRTYGGNNTAPVLLSVGNRSVSAGATLSIQLSATDADGDALEYSASAEP
jgi:hypothetical protein